MFPSRAPGRGSPPAASTRSAAPTGSASRLLLRQAVEGDPVGASPVALDDVLGPLDRCVRPQHFAERLQLRPAESLAGRCGHADRAVVLHQDVPLSLRPRLRHVPFPGPRLGQPGHPLAQVGRPLQRRRVGRPGLGRPRSTSPRRPRVRRHWSNRQHMLSRTLGPRRTCGSDGDGVGLLRAEGPTSARGAHER